MEHTGDINEESKGGGDRFLYWLLAEDEFVAETGTEMKDTDAKKAADEENESWDDSLLDLMFDYDNDEEYGSDDSYWEIIGSEYVLQHVDLD